MRNRQMGLTLIETVLVLLVAAIIMGGIWLGYSQLRLNEQVNDTVAIIDQTVQITRDYLSKYSASQGIPMTLSQDLYNAGLMPPQLTYYGIGSSPNNLAVYSDSIVFIAPNGGNFVVEPPAIIGFTNGFSGPQHAYFEIQLATKSPTQCMQLASELFGTVQSMNSRGLIGWWGIGPHYFWANGQYFLSGSGNTPETT